MDSKKTFSILFLVRRSRINKNGQIPVFARITVNGKRAEISLNHSIDSRLWNTQKGCAIGKSKEAVRLNALIETYRGQLYQHYKMLLLKDITVTAMAVKNAFLGIEEEKRSIIEVFRDHNNRLEKLIGKEYSRLTWNRYNYTLNHLQNFIRHEYHKDDFVLTQVTNQFIINFEFYLKSECGCAHNTAMKYLKNLKKITRIAIANEWLRKDPFINYKITIKKVDRGYLSKSELQLIHNKHFTIERLSNVKDCFLFSCYTGLAYADIKKLSSENIVTIDGKKWIQTQRTKTNNACHIPLLPVAENILLKYKDFKPCISHGVLLPVLSNQKMNAYLKEIGDICGITKELTTHMARHTFATTITLNNDVPIETVSKMLGHSSISMTKIYARLLDKKVEKDMAHLHDKF